MSDYNYNNSWYQDNPSQRREYSPAPDERPGKRRRIVELTAGKVVSLALCCSLVGGALGAGGMMLAGGAAGTETARTSSAMLEGERLTPVIGVTSVDTSRELTPTENYAANVNSTVGIWTEVITTNYWGFQSRYPAAGSGFILTEDGYVLTNYHVVQNANSVKVTTFDGASYEAVIVGYDVSSDVAVLKIDAEGLTPVVLGDSDTLRVGDTVMAIGNPLGEMTFSQTVGTVSALDREVTFSNGLTMDLIQTDCAINSGNSGGALFNLYGEVIGITNAKSSGNGSTSSASVDNIGFAIPINSVRSIFQSLVEKGCVVKPYIGVSVRDVSEDALRFGLPRGAAIAGVVEGSPAEEAGLQENDIIVSADGEEITSGNDLVEAVQKCQPGDQLKLTVYRQGGELELTVRVGEKLGETVVEQPESQQPESQQGDGLDMEDLWERLFGNF